MQTDTLPETVLEGNLTPAITETTTNESTEISKDVDTKDTQEIENDPSKQLRPILPFENETLRLKQKCKDLKQKISDLEAQNQVRAISVSRVKDAISRSRFEYSILLESLEKKSKSLPIPDLKNVTLDEIDAGTVESLRMEDITNLLSHTPLEMLNVKNRLPGALGELLYERQQQFAKAHQKELESPVKQTRRKRGTVNGAGGNSRKRVRDPREPKRPTNAYLFFCDSEREKIKTEWAENHPDEHIDLSKAMTEVWKSMTDDDKKPYFEKYEKDRARYQKAVEEFEIIKEKERLAAESTQPSDASASGEPEEGTPNNIYSEPETPIDPDVSMDATFDESSNTNKVKSTDLDDNEDDDEGEEEDDRLEEENTAAPHDHVDDGDAEVGDIGGDEEEDEEDAEDGTDVPEELEDEERNDSVYGDVSMREDLESEDPNPDMLSEPQYEDENVDEAELNVLQTAAQSHVLLNDEPNTQSQDVLPEEAKPEVDV